MKSILLAVLGMLISMQLHAHYEDTVMDCSYGWLNGHWEAFYPNGEPLANDIEEGAHLHIRYNQMEEEYRVVLDESAWEVTDTPTAECTTVPILAIPIEKEGFNRYLCVQRIRNVFGLEKRPSQMYPKIKQVGLAIKSSPDDCMSDIKITPGHAHADD